MGPLTGVRVLELAGLGPAPFATMLLADMGADVVRIDRPANVSSPRPDPRAHVVDRGRRSIQLDLKTAAGLGTALQLVERSHVLIEGFRPGVAERLGLGPQECLERNPVLVYGRMTGWGQTGPLAPTAGHDLGYISVTGTLRDLCRDGGRPVTPMPLIGDTAGGGAFLALGVVAALFEAQHSGQGQVIDAAIIDGVAVLTALTQSLRAQGRWGQVPGTNFGNGGAPYYDVYETSDGHYVAIAAIEDQFWNEFLELLGPVGAGLPSRTDRSNWPTLRHELAEIFRSRTRAEWVDCYEASDACLTPVLTFDEAPDHPHLAARGTYVRNGDAIHPMPAPRFSRTPSVLPVEPPAPGEHTAEILAELGVTPQASPRSHDRG